MTKKELELELKKSQAQVRHLLRTINRHCYACSGNVKREVERCPLHLEQKNGSLVQGCWLYPYRMGMWPTTVKATVSGSGVPTYTPPKRKRKTSR